MPSSRRRVRPSTHDPFPKPKMVGRGMSRDAPYARPAHPTELVLEGVDAALDVAGFAGALDDRAIPLGDDDALGAAEVGERDGFERDAEVLEDGLAAALLSGQKVAILDRMRKRRQSRRGREELFDATKLASSLLVLFIPSRDRLERPIDQAGWVRRALETLGKLFGGATAYPRGQGVWRDDAQGGKLLFDEPVVVQCYTSAAALEGEARRLREFLVRMGTECRQGAVGFVIDRDYLEISFPLERGSS